MTGLGPPIPPDRQLGAADIRRLFDRLSSHLRAAGSTGHHLMIAGGAALALMWEDRTTHDVDVLEHRFPTPHASDSERRTTAVDFISMRFPAELVRAARLVADAEGLPRNWLNGAVAIFTPAGDLEPQVLHQDDCLTVEAPSPAVLLAMKLHAARPLDADAASDDRGVVADHNHRDHPAVQPPRGQHQGSRHQVHQQDRRAGHQVRRQDRRSGGGITEVRERLGRVEGGGR